MVFRYIVFVLLIIAGLFGVGKFFFRINVDRQLVQEKATASYVEDKKFWFAKKKLTLDAIDAFTHYEYLKELEWLIGEWVGEITIEDKNFKVNSQYFWSKNRNYIVFDHTITITNAAAIASPIEQQVEHEEGSEIIYWDPYMKIIRSQFLNLSNGASSKGRWTHEGSNWILEDATLSSDGKIGSLKVIYTPLNDNLFLWGAKNRKEDGKDLPDIAPMVNVRKNEN